MRFAIAGEETPPDITFHMNVEPNGALYLWAVGQAQGELRSKTLLSIMTDGSVQVNQANFALFNLAWRVA